MEWFFLLCGLDINYILVILSHYKDLIIVLDTNMTVRQ